MENLKTMSIGPVGDPSITFVREFRFTLAGEHLSEAFNTSVDVDWGNKTINLAAYEAITPQGIHIHNWCDAMERGEYPDETLVLTTYDGCGKALYQFHFKKLVVRGRRNSFDYANSEVSLHRVNISFEESVKEITNLSCDRDPTIKDDRPLAEINHLNAKCWTK